MRVGVPKEIKIHEYRVGLTPEAVRELRRPWPYRAWSRRAGPRHRRPMPRTTRSAPRSPPARRRSSIPPR